MASDADDFHRLWMELASLANTGMATANDPAVTAAQVQLFEQLCNAGLYAKWTLRTRADDQFAGECELYPLMPQIHPWREWRLGFSLLSAYWGRGWMGQAITAVLEVAKAERWAERVIADVAVTNERSQRLLQRLGFHQEGVQIGKGKGAEGPVDMQLWACNLGLEDTCPQY